jgi:hypothetical protein
MLLSVECGGNARSGRGSHTHNGQPQTLQMQVVGLT